MTVQGKQGLRKLALVATAVFSACQMMAFVLYPYFSEATGLTLAFIVGSFSVGSLLFLWGSPYWARRCEASGSAYVLALGVTGLLLSQVALLVVLLAAKHMPAPLSAGLLGGSRILYGLTASAIVPVSQAIMADSSEPAARMQAMVRHSLSLHLGRLIGPLIVWLGLFWSRTTPLWIAAGLLLVLAFFTFEASDRNVNGAASGTSPRLHWPRTTPSRMLLVIAFALTSLVGILQSSLTHHLQTMLHLDSHSAAQLTLQFLLASSVVTVVIQALMQKLVHDPWQGTLPLGAICLAVSCFLLSQFQSQGELWWALPVFAAGLALLTPSYTAALSLRENFAQQGAVAGLLGATHTLGYAAGGLLTAVLMSFDARPLSLAWHLSLVLLLLAFTMKAGSEHHFKTLTRDKP